MLSKMDVHRIQMVIGVVVGLATVALLYSDLKPFVLFGIVCLLVFIAMVLVVALHPEEWRRPSEKRTS